MNATFQSGESVIQLLRSVGIGVWTLVVALLTLIIVCFQVILMKRQTKIMNRQLDILETQNLLLARRANFSLKCTAHPLQNPPRLSLRFFVQNTGENTARDYYWHIYVPMNLGLANRELRTSRGPAATHIQVGVNNDSYKYYTVIVINPLYPTRRELLGELEVNPPGAGQSLTVLWRIISEDGKVPSGELEFGTLDIV